MKILSPAEEAALALMEKMKDLEARYALEYSAESLAGITLASLCRRLLAEREGVRDSVIEVISDLEGGFVRCQKCGDQEDTATLDCVRILRAILKEPS